MLRIISQNIINYGIEVPDNTILRINLAWCSSVKQLRNILYYNVCLEDIL